MNLIEPTYLRYVHDSLDKGSLNAENAAALPYGFIGLYEEAFQSDIPISKRQSTLKRLAIWALFKGGISSYLASQILVESQEDTKSLIENFSSWFNITDSNKYILYHDRLRTYLLQKLSSNEIQELNEQIISYLEKAIETQKEDEAEIYALEHLSTHMAIESQMDSNYQRLHDFANQETLWPRQVSVSKEYKWSQYSLQLAIKEASRFKNRNYLSKSIDNSVILFEKEQNQFDDIMLFLDNEMFQIAFERTQRIESLNQLKILIYIAIDFAFGSKKTHKSKDFVLKKVSKIIKEYYSIASNDFNWLSFINHKIMLGLCVEFQKSGFDLSLIFSNLIFSFKEFDEFFLTDTDYKVKLDLLDNIQIRQFNALIELEYHDFDNLIEDIEFVVGNLLFKFKKEINSLDIPLGKTQTIPNIYNDIKLIHEKTSGLVTDFISRNNTEENKFSKESCTDKINKIIISKCCELTSYLIDSSDKSISIKKENNFDQIIVKSYEIIIQLNDEVFYANNKIDCVSYIVDYTIRSNNDDKLKDYCISYYNNFQSLNFKDKLFKIELLIKFCIANSKINNQSNFQEKLFCDLKNEIEKEKKKILNDKLNYPYDSKQSWENEIIKLLIIYANELIIDEDFSKHDQIIKIISELCLILDGIIINKESQEIYLEYINKKISQDNTINIITHLNSYLFYLKEFKQSINLNSEIKISDLVLFLFSNSSIKEYPEDLSVLINNYTEHTLGLDSENIFPKQILLRILEKIDYSVLTDFLLKSNNIHLFTRLIDIIPIDKLSETKLINEFLNTLENKEKFTIETALNLINLEHKFTKSNLVRQYEILIDRFIKNCFYELDNPKLNFSYLIELINKIQSLERSTKLNNVKESLNLLKIKLIKESNELLLNDKAFILEGILKAIENIGFSDYKFPLILDNIYDLYNQTQSFSTIDCKVLIRDNVDIVIDTILDICFKTENQIDFILTYHELEKLASKLGIQINKHNYNISRDNLFDELISKSFPYVLSSNVMENRFAFKEWNDYEELATDYKLLDILVTCSHDDSRFEYLKYLVPTEEQYQIAEHDFEYAMLHIRSDEFEAAFDCANKIEEDSIRVKNLLFYYFIKILIEKKQPDLIEKALQLIDDDYFIGLSRIEIIFSEQINEEIFSLNHDLIQFIQSLNYDWERNSMINELILKSKKKENIQFLEKFKSELVSKKYITECDYGNIQNNYDFKSDDYYRDFWSEGAYAGEIFAENAGMDEHIEKRREMHFLSKTKRGKEKLKLMKVGLLSHKFGDSVSPSYDIVLKDFNYCLNNTLLI